MLIVLALGLRLVHHAVHPRRRVPVDLFQERETHRSPAARPHDQPRGD